MSHHRTTRTTRGSRLSHHSSIAETDQEEATDVGPDSPISSDSNDDAAQTARANTYSYSLNKAVRSPYVTRSTSKTRQASTYQRSNAAMSSPTKALTFNEGEEDAEEAASPTRRRHAHAAPPTPGQMEAHDDADVYAEDCCDHHDVRLGRHSHGPTHKHLPRPKYKSPTPTPVPRTNDSRTSESSSSDQSTLSPSGVWWKVLLALLLTSLAGPWMLEQFTLTRPPSVVQTGVITQADLDRIIAHVTATVRTDLTRAKYVTEPRLEEATIDLSQRLVQERNQHVASAVNDALRQVDSKLAQALAEENIEDASTLSAVRAELLKIIDARTGQAMKEWSEKIVGELEKELAGEKTERNVQLQNLLAEIQALRLADAQTNANERAALKQDVLQEAAQERSSLKRAVLDEIGRLFAEEQVEDRSVSDAFDAKLKSLLAEENQEDATTLQKHLFDTRNEFQSLLATRLDARLEEFEVAFRRKFMNDAAATFAPLSAVLTPADRESSASLKEDLILQRLKSYVANLVDELPKPKSAREVDEPALEARVVQRVVREVEGREAASEQRVADKVVREVDQRDRVQALQKRVDALGEEVASATTQAAHAESLAKSRPASAGQPTVIDHSAELAALAKQLAELRAKDHSTELEALRKQVGELRARPEPVAPKDHSEEIAAIERKIAALVAEPKPKDHSSEIATLSQQIADLSATAQPTATGKDHSKEVEAIATQLAELREELARVQREVADREEKRGVTAAAESQQADSLDVESMRREIALALERYSADRTSRVDYALRSSGGRVLAHSPSNRVPVEGPWWLAPIKQCFTSVRPPEEVINDDMSVGSCWPMAGVDGFVSLGLREKIVPTAISLQHVARTIVPDHSTTPKEFTVWGVEDSQHQWVRQHTNAKPIGVNLGRFTYLSNSTQVQTFELQPQKARSFSIVTVGFHSNYGNPAYTCVYRVRVHGTPI